jgi:AhpC/TSA family
MAMRSLLLIALAVLAALSVQAAVVRPAPNFSFPGAGGVRSLQSLRGQSVVLLVTRSPKEGDFKKQLKYLREIYQQFASKQVVFIAALREGEGPIASNIPFAVATNGAAVAEAYGVADDFNIVIIGRDGNIDYQTKKVLTPERVRDVIQNSFLIQSSARKQ